MSKDTGRGSRNPKPKIFGTNPPQVGEDDVSRLVGGIVEKGFSQVPQTRPLAPPSAPRPTVLPFPMARHRSHGPVCVILSVVIITRYPFFFFFGMLCHCEMWKSLKLIGLLSMCGCND